MSWKSFWKKIGSYVTDWVETITGTAVKKQAEKAQQLAEESQEFNERYSEKQLTQQEAQFEKNNELANRNVDFQKDIAEKNLALQTDAFNAQLKENELTRQREDTAYQRQAADLKAAGFSPLMASNGANAASMSVGSAPQYDGSSVATAQGSAIQLAQEYAALRNMAQGQYLTRKQAAVNERIGAIMALSEISANRRQNFQNLALSGANLAMNIRDMKKKHQLLDAQIKNAKDMGEWSNNYGWRNLNTISILKHYGETLADVIGLDKNTIIEGLNAIKSEIYITNQQLEHMYDGSESGFTELKNKVDILKGSEISKDSFDDLVGQLLNPGEVSDSQIQSWYKQMNNSFRSKYSFNYFYDAVTGKSRWKRSVIYKYLMFGNNGNI